MISSFNYFFCKLSTGLKIIMILEKLNELHTRKKKTSSKEPNTDKQDEQYIYFLRRHTTTNELH